MLIFSISAFVFSLLPLILAGNIYIGMLSYLMPFFAVLFIIAVVGIVLMVVGLCMKRKVNRTTIKVAYSHIEETNSKVSKLLKEKGYKSISEHGENVWKCGIGFLTAMKYIKIEFENNTMLVSGWVRVVGGNEQDLKGAFVCVIPKKQVMDVINEIQSCVC